MADRNSAKIFGVLFVKLAEEEPDERRKDWALYLWDMAFNYDFTPEQMECDEALVKLGLARLDRKEEGCFVYATRKGTLRS